MVWSEALPHGGFTTATAKPWLPVPAEHLPLAVERQAQHDDSLLACYRTLLAWRRRLPALVKGSIQFLDLHPQVLAFERRHGDECLLVAFNLAGGQPLEVDLTPTLVERLQEDLTPPVLHGRLDQQRLSLPPHSGLIARLAYGTDHP